MRKASRLAIVALLLAACGAPVEPAGTSTPPAQTTTTTPNAEDDFAIARAKWENGDLETYHFTFENDCGECDPAVMEPRLVVVRNDQAATPGDATVDGLFETIALALREGTSVEVSYDPGLGYPTEIWLDREARAYDGGTHWLIRDLQEGSPAPGSSDLVDARQQWADAGLTSYRYDLVIHDIIEASFSDPYTLTVQEGKVVSVEFQGDSQPAEGIPELTIEELFTLIEEETAAGSIVEVLYHDHDGHPVFVSVRGADGSPPSMVVSIHELTPLP